MSGISIDKLFEQAFKQAGYAGSAVMAGARDQLIGYVGNLLSQNGQGDPYESTDEFDTNECDINGESNAFEYGNAPVVQQCSKEGGAAAMAALIGGASNAIGYFELVRSGKMNPKEACLNIVRETITSATDSAIKAAGTSGMAMLQQRYGSETSAMQSLAKQGLSILMQKIQTSSNCQGLLGSITQMIGLGQVNGHDSQEGLSVEDSSMVLVNENPIVKMAGEGAMNLFKSKMPNLPKGMPSHPAFIAVALAVEIGTKVAIQNCIERPYQDLVRNTTTLRDASQELERISGDICKGQQLFGKFLESDAEMEAQLQMQMDRVDRAGQDARDVILNI